MARALTPSTTHAVTYQAILFEDPQASFAQKTYQATLGETAVTLVRVSATQVGLLTPEMAPGSYSLKATLDGFAYASISLTVGTATAPADPVAYVSAQLQSSVTSIQGYQAQWVGRADLMPALNAALADVQAYQVTFAGLDAATQSKIATALAANDPLQAQDFITGWSTKVLTAWVVVAADAAAVASSAAIPGGQAVAVAFAVKFVADAAALVDLYGTGTAQAFEPAAAINDPISDQKLVKLFFTDATPETVPLSVAMQNLSKDDLNSKNATVQKDVTIFTDFAAVFAAADPYVSTPLGTPPSLADIDPVVKDVPADGTLFSIKNISSDSVKLADYAGAMGSGSMTFTSPTCPKGPDIEFSFDLVYDDSVFPAITVTVPATLSCAMCMNAQGGPAPAGRYSVLDPGTGPYGASGIVLDNTTGLKWARYYYPFLLDQASASSYCQSLGARLPTKGEALAITGVNYDSCAWPVGWETWTSTSAGAPFAWVVGVNGAVAVNVATGDLTICVR